nr:hypothetical protein [Tanacetum cinerariifolium]
MGEEFKAFKPQRSFYETPSSSSSPTLSVRKRYRGTSKLILDIDIEGDELGDEDHGLNDESQGLDDKGHGLGDEDHGLDDESQGLEDEGLGLEDETIPKVQQQAVLVARIVMSEPLGLSYEALRCRELAVGEDQAPSTFKPTLDTWVDLEDGRVYTNIPAYVPLAAPVQTPSSLEWSLGSLPVSPLSPVVPSPIALPVATSTTIISIDDDQFIEVNVKYWGSKMSASGSLLKENCLTFSKVSKFRLRNETISEDKLLYYAFDTVYGLDSIRRITDESALAVEINFTWSFEFGSVEPGRPPIPLSSASVKARISLIIFEFSSRLFADSSMNLVSDSFKVCLRSGSFSGNGTFRVKDMSSRNIELIIKQDYFMHISQIYDQVGSTCLETLFSGLPGL